MFAISRKNGYLCGIKLQGAQWGALHARAPIARVRTGQR